MENVKWKRNYFKADAGEVADELSNLGDSYTAKDIVRYARENEDSELHKCFEWDDTVAAEKYRERQARQIVQLLVYTNDSNNSNKMDKLTSHLRVVYHSDITDTYQPTSVIIKNQDEYESLLHRAYEELRAFERKYSMLTELSDIFALIDNLD